MIMRTQNDISAIVYDMYVRALCWPDMAWQATYALGPIMLYF